MQHRALSAVVILGNLRICARGATHTSSCACSMESRSCCATSAWSTSAHGIRLTSVCPPGRGSGSRQCSSFEMSMIQQGERTSSVRPVATDRPSCASSRIAVSGMPANKPLQADGRVGRCAPSRARR
jgi:hypothetical protein